MRNKNLLNRLRENIINEFKKDRSVFVLKGFAFFLVLLFMLLPLLLFWKNFGSNKLSNDFKNWVDFATYISGTITPILAIINILVLYQLTRTAKKIEQRNIASQLRKEEYVQIKKSLDKLLEISKDENSTKDEKRKKAENLLIILESFLDDYEFLFPGLKNKDESEKLLDAIESYISTSSIESYIDPKSNFLRLMQDKFLLNTKTIIN